MKENFFESCLWAIYSIFSISNFFLDIKFLKIFIITYKSFATPPVVLRKLKQRFMVPDYEPEKTKKIVQSKFHLSFFFLFSCS